MRIILPILVFSLIYSQGKCQNWQLFHKDRTYLYALEHDSLQAIAFSYRTLNFSATISGSDTIFQGNRLVQPVEDHPRNQYDDRVWENVPSSMLGSQVLKTPNSYSSLDPGGMSWLPYAPKDTSWVLDSLNGIMALVDSIYQDSVLGQMDSVKRILLSSGDTILASKTFGLLRFPPFRKTGQYARLVGLENPELGLQVPKLHDLYDFDPGDVFYFKRTHHGVNSSDYERWIRREVVARQKVGDTLRYSYLDSVVFYWRVTYGLGHLSIRNVTIDYLDSAGHPLSSYPGEYTQEYVYWNLDESEFSLDPVCGNKCLNPIYIVRDSLGRLHRSFGLKEFPNENYNWYTSTYFLKDSVNNPTFMGQNHYVSGGEAFFGKGIGLAWFNKGYFESHDGLYLLGYIKGGDTTGNVIPQSILTDIEDLSKTKLNFVYKRDQHALAPTTEQSVARAEQLSLIDLSGKVVLAQGYTGNQIDLPELANGMYILKVISGVEKPYWQKIMIKR
ncbi:MAG: T9SS type A sorting domain-containing protein [Bacteroidia bacterium]|nr:T9SS type A sorting domain-containing protein [Bacteroidia bacterium]